MKLIAYGSFSCPYSFLASRRVDRLCQAGVADVEWRAVVHDPDVPSGGIPVAGELAETLDRELEEIRGLLQPGEDFPATRPPVQPNTVLAVAGYSVAAGADARRLRVALFDAYWTGGLDLGAEAVLDELGCTARSPGVTMQRWREEWLSSSPAMVPLVVFPGNRAVSGLAALRRLADLEMDRIRLS